MKHIRLIIMILFVLFSSSIVKAQTADEIYETKSVPSLQQYDREQMKQLAKQTRYWKRYKVLGACGWTALPVGSLAFVVGSIGALGNTLNDNAYGPSDTRGFETVAFIGLGVAVSSVPVLVCAYVNRGKAMKSARLSLQGSVIGKSLPMGTQKSHPALSLCLNF